MTNAVLGVKPYVENFRNLICIGVIFAATSVALAGNTCTWQGGSGKFSDANWDVAPVSGNGDTLVFDTSNGTAITVENDVADDFAIRSIHTAAGTGWASYGTITLTGRRLYFDATASRSEVDVIVCGTGHPNRGAPMTFEAPLRFKGGCMRFSNTVVFNGKITIDDNGFISLGWPTPRSTESVKPVTFNNEIYGPNASADIVPGNGGHGSRLDFNGKLTLKALYNNGAYMGGKPKTYFNATGNAIETFTFKYNHQIYCNVANAFDDTLVINDVSGQPELGVVNFGADQVINRFTDMAGIAPTNACRYVGTAKTVSTVTMRASASTTICNTFEDTLALVWDPKDDYTFTLEAHGPSATNTMSGAIEVKGGTFALSGNTSFTKLAGVTVRNGATFSLAQSTATQPLPKMLALVLEDGGHFEVPAGMTIPVATITTNGVPAATSGVYTKDNCSWVTGDGAVESRLVMVPRSTLAMGESLHEQTKCWTNDFLKISVPPNQTGATNFDYLVHDNWSLRTPQNAGTYTYHGRSLTVGEVGGKGGSLVECSYRGVVTNVIENEGLFLAKGSIAFNGGRFGKSTWTGRITVLSPQGSEFSLVGGSVEEGRTSQMFISGTLIGAPGVGIKAGSGQFSDVTGQRVTIDADASQYFGRLQAHGVSGWMTLGDTVFNGSVVCTEGCAFGTERATDTAQVKALSFDAATPFVVPVAAAGETEGAAGCVVVTNSFSQSAKVTVYHRGRMWYGKMPVLKLAPGCTGTLDIDQFEFGGYMTDYRVADSSDTTANWPKTLKLEVGEDPVDGGQVLYLSAAPRGTTVLFR